MEFTRRKLAAVVLAPVAAAAVESTAQESGEDALLQAARERYQMNFAAVNKVEVPMATEPAFQFKA